jgi:LytS/YehU family sensor histidine kinase
MNLEDACADCQVPPLLFQPLIENAIKHGIATLIDGGTIRVESRIKDDALVASVENHFDPDSRKAQPSGLGLRNIRSRLETLFGPSAWLATDRERGLFRAVISLPCRKLE